MSFVGFTDAHVGFNEYIDTWTTREHLCLALAVQKSGDQNWAAISKTVQMLSTDASHPPDWYNTRNCSVQYSKLLEQADSSKSKSERTNETAEEMLTKVLVQQRMEQLRTKIKEEKDLYDKLFIEIQQLQAGQLDANLDKLWDECICEQEEQEEKISSHKQWLLEREEKIKEIQSQEKYKGLKKRVADVKRKSESSSTSLDETKVEIENPGTHIPATVTLSNNQDSLVNNADKVEDKSKSEVSQTVMKEEIYSWNVAEIKDELSCDVPVQKENLTDEKDKVNSESEKLNESLISEDISINTEGNSENTELTAPEKNVKTDQTIPNDETTLITNIKEEVIEEECHHKKDIQLSRQDDCIDSETDISTHRVDKKKVSVSDSASGIASPLFSESTPNSPASTHFGDDVELEKSYRTWKRSIIIVWNDIASHKYASIFLKPIKEEQARGYYSVVHRPMDLQKIKRNIENGIIRNTAEFQRDVMLMFLNAKMYNRRNHDVFKMATYMMKDALANIEEFHSTQMMARTADSPKKSLRRDARESSIKQEDGPKRKAKDNEERNVKKRKI